jgi:ATP-dependent DNA helicase PIF1
MKKVSLQSSELIQPEITNIHIDSLSKEQKYAYNKFIQGENLFITGPGGTGKTRLVKYLVDYAKSTAKNVQVCAMTGCAAVLLQCNARTLHSWSGIKLAKGSKKQVIDSVLRNRNACNAWKTAKILILDEISMLSKKIFNIIEELGRVIRKSTLPFGGLQVIFVGDFYQLPPVGTEGEPDTEQYCFESLMWKTVFKQENHIELRTIFRQKDTNYIDILMQIRKGELDEENRTVLQKYLNREYDVEKNNGCIPTKLFAIRSKVDYVNTQMFAKLQEKEYVFQYEFKFDCLTYLDSGKVVPPDLMQKCRSLSNPDKEFELELLLNNSQCNKILRLKKGAAVMCTINLDMDNGICNGSQGIVIDIVEIGTVQTPIVKFSNGIIKRISPHYWQSEDYPTLAVGQYPLCLAWALTIHKIQGATLTMAEIDIGRSIFEYGQTYVALSRIQSLDGLYLSAFEPGKIKTNPIVNEFYSGIEDIEYNEETNVFEETMKKLEYKDLDIKIVTDVKPITDIKVVKINKIPTDKISFDLFLQSKSITEIGEKRSLKENTVYEHIILNLPHEEIDYDRFMSKAEYDEIRNAYILLGKDSLLMPIKDIISQDISFQKIKIVKKLLFNE